MKCVVEGHLIWRLQSLQLKLLMYVSLIRVIMVQQFQPQMMVQDCDEEV